MQIAFIITSLIVLLKRFSSMDALCGFSGLSQGEKRDALIRIAVNRTCCRTAIERFAAHKRYRCEQTPYNRTTNEINSA
jgi:hypothetical protein